MVITRDIFLKRFKGHLKMIRYRPRSYLRMQYALQNYRCPFEYVDCSLCTHNYLDRCVKYNQCWKLSRTFDENSRFYQDYIHGRRGVIRTRQRNKLIDRMLVLLEKWKDKGVSHEV